MRRVRLAHYTSALALLCLSSAALAQPADPPGATQPDGRARPAPTRSDAQQPSPPPEQPPAPSLEPPPAPPPAPTPAPAADAPSPAAAELRVTATDPSAAEQEVSASGSAAAEPPKPRIADFRVSLARGLSWDLNVEAGVGLPLSGELDKKSRYMGRLRLGLLVADEPFFLALGVVGELGGLVGQGAGLQLELLDFYTGLSAHGGVLYAGQGAWTTHLGLGFAIFGVEWTHAYEAHPDARNALFFKVHVPIGVIALML